MRDLHSRCGPKENENKFWKHVASFMRDRGWISVRNKAHAINLRSKVVLPKCIECGVRNIYRNKRVCSVCDSIKNPTERKRARAHYVDQNPALVELVDDLSTTIKEIAELAGLSRQAFYNCLHRGKIGNVQAAYRLLIRANSMYPGKWPDKRLKEIIGVKAETITTGNYVDLPIET